METKAKVGVGHVHLFLIEEKKAVVGWAIEIFILLPKLNAGSAQLFPF